MADVKIPPGTAICILNAAPSFNRAVAKVAENSPGVAVWKGRAAAYGRGSSNPALFATDMKDRPLSAEARQDIRRMLARPDTALHIVNSAAGAGACVLELGGIHAIRQAFRECGGKIYYDMPYDDDGTNDKVHEVEIEEADGTVSTHSEENIAAGEESPHIYHEAGAAAVAVFDPHSRKHVANLQDAFGRAHTAVLSNLEPIAEDIIKRQKKALLAKRFRLVVPDGWDKRHDPEHNAAMKRAETLAGMIWEKMPALHALYEQEGGRDGFIWAVQSAGIIKGRVAPRPGAPAKPVVKGFIGDVKGCVCEMIDDLADSGRSLTESARALMANGARRVDASICHGPSSAASFERILHTAGSEGGRYPLIRHLTVTNTIPEVEKIRAGLVPKDKRRVTILNCAAGYLAYLGKRDGHEDEAEEADFSELMELRL